MNNLFPSPAAGPFGRRQRRVRGARMPVTVLTGFLGAGKTTLLRHFLTTEEGHGTAVVVNEFGAAGIDDVLMRESADETVLLGNGCLCCITRTDLQQALRRMVIERERGEIPDFRRVVIETSGLADPSPILQTFSTDRALGDTFHVEAVVTVIDAETGGDTLAWSAEARKQAILADRLVITKTDIAGAGAAEALRARLVTRVMETLLTMRGTDVLRVKGFLNVHGCKGPVMVQFVQHLAHPPVELEDWPDGDRRSRVVFITRGISEKQVRDLFAAVGALNPTA